MAFEKQWPLFQSCFLCNYFLIFKNDSTEPNYQYFLIKFFSWFLRRWNDERNKNIFRQNLVALRFYQEVQPPWESFRNWSYSGRIQFSSVSKVPAYWLMAVAVVAMSWVHYQPAVPEMFGCIGAVNFLIWPRVISGLNKLKEEQLGTKKLFRTYIWPY